MAHHDDHNHSTEKKQGSFTVPLILGSITVFIILLFVSLGNPKHGECACAEDCSNECAEACAKGDHSMHPDKMMHHGEMHGDMHGKACGECDNCKAGKECSHMNMGHGECPECKDGKVCAHHAEGGEGMHGKMHADCPECKDGQPCAHHAEQAVETTEHTAEPAKEEDHH